MTLKNEIDVREPTSETTEKLRPRREIDCVVEARRIIDQSSRDGRPGIYYHQGLFRSSPNGYAIRKDEIRAAIWQSLVERFAKVRPSDVSAVVDAMMGLTSPRPQFMAP